MLAVVESYIKTKFDELNQNYDTGIKINQITNDLQLGQIAASQADVNWQMFLENFDYTNYLESLGWFTIDVRLDMFFQIAGKDNTIYKSKYDNYVYPLAKSFWEDASGFNYSTGDNSNIKLLTINSLSVNNGDRFENDYYNPSMILNITGFDETTTEIGYNNLSE
jgi:hypothetical protein